MKSLCKSIAVMCLVFIPGVHAFGAGFTVDSLGDASDAAPGDGVCATAGAVCTLRAAIEEANSLAGGDDIAFSVSGTIFTGSILPPVIEDLVIDGSGAVIIVDGVLSDALLAINNSVNATLRRLTFSRGAGALGGAIANRGALRVEDCHFSENEASQRGGAIFNTGTIVVTGSTLENNRASVEGGGIANVGTAFIINSTFSGNDADSAGLGVGGAILNDSPGTISITNSTLSGNQAANGGGLACALSCNVGNSILAGNSSVFYPDVFGTVTSAGGNLVGVGDGSSGFTGSGDKVGTSAAPIDPMLGLLQLTRGTTRTMVPQPGSPAIDSGINGSSVDESGLTLTTDQTGAARFFGAAVDAGSFETGAGFTFTVTKTADTDDGSCDVSDCSLREAIVASKSVPGSDRIDFDIPAADPGCTVPGTCTIVLSSDPELILGDVAIDGQAQTITISGGGSFGVFRIGASANVWLNQVAITGGGSQLLGGGIFIGPGADVRATRLSIYGNAAARGAGIYSFGDLVLHDSVIFSNTSSSDGGGIYNDYPGRVEVSNSTIYGNDSGRNGGGIFTSRPRLDLKNSTVAGNSAATFGGGIYNGSGLVSDPAGVIAIRNTLIGDNTAVADGPDISGRFDSFGYNLIENTAGSSLEGDLTGNITGIDPQFDGTLQDNGGTTHSIAIACSSPARNAGNNTFNLDPWGTVLKYDQREFPYYRIAGGTIDIGAFEKQSCPYSTSLEVSPASGTYGGTVDLSAVLTLADAGTPLQGQTVSFKLNGTDVGSASTDASGTASLNGVSLAGMNAGSYATGVEAVFAGDGTYLPVTGTASLNVGKSPQSVTFSPIPDKTYGDSPFSVSPTATSGLPVTIGTSGDCVNSGYLITIIGAGACTVTASQSGDSNYDPADDVERTFQIGLAVLTVSADHKSSQYSDPLADLTYSIEGFVNGDTAAVVSGAPDISTDVVPTSAPGDHEITISIGTLTAENYSFSFASGTYSILREDARPEYTGSMFVNSSCSSCDNALIFLSATIVDISAVAGDPDTDAYPGDIRNAVVTFAIKDDSGNLIANVPASAVSLVNPGDQTVGTAAALWEIVLPANSDSETFFVGVVAGGHYTGGDDSLVTVSRPIGENFITGGGFLLLDNSVGTFEGAPGTRANFGFNVKYNKGGKKLQGRLNLVFWSGGRRYQVKGTAMSSLSTNSPASSPRTAGYEGKATLSDVTDPDNPVSIGGNLLVSVSMTDRGEPGDTDSIAFSVWDGSMLLFSSSWNGTRTVEQVIRSGNLVVH